MEVGDIIRIDYLNGEFGYSGRIGKVTKIDDMGQIHGTWGGLAVSPSYGDEFSLLFKCPYTDGKCSTHSQCAECPLNRKES